jgi:microcystin-dependent protein
MKRIWEPSNLISYNMRRLISLLSLLFILNNFSDAQTPQGFKYQAVVRDNSGLALANKLVAIRLSLLLNSPNGTSVYSEVHKIATNDFGIANLNVGSGANTTGNFATIDWGAGTYFLKTEADITNGTNFVFLGTSQLLSVPYAMFAAKSANAANDFDKDSLNEIQNISLNGNNLQLNKNGGSIDLTKYTTDIDTDSQSLSLKGHTLAITRGNNIQLNDIDSLNEIQTLTLSNNNLQLNKNGGSVDLTKYDKDSQQLVLSGNTLSITKGNTIVLSGAVDLDSDPTNEIQNITLKKDTISISKSNYIILPKDNDTDSTNEIQSLIYKNDTIQLSKANNIVLPKDNDRDSTNELQQLSLNKNNLSISNGNQISIDADTTNEIQSITIINDSLKISKANSVYLPTMPAGSIISYGGRSIPTGWLLCDGNTVSRTQYINLFIAIDSVWGNGDGYSTFHLPDLRGQFLRGVSGTSNFDPDTTLRIAKYNGGNTGNKVGSFQNDELKSHNHYVTMSSYPTGSNGVFANGGTFSGGGTVNSTGGNETRPKNAYVYYIIKY